MVSCTHLSLCGLELQNFSIFKSSMVVEGFMELCADDGYLEISLINGHLEEFMQRMPLLLEICMLSVQYLRV